MRESWVRSLTVWNLVCPLLVVLAMILSLGHGCSLVDYGLVDFLAFISGWAWLVIVPGTAAAALVINRHPEARWKPGTAINWIILSLWLLSVLAVSAITILSSSFPE